MYAPYLCHVSAMFPEVHYSAQAMEQTSPGPDWLCTNRRAIPLSPRMSGRTDKLASAVTHWEKRGRISRQTWVRYRIQLSKLPERPEDVALEPVSDSFIQSLRAGEEKFRENQIRSAVRFWDGGLKSAYLWGEDGEPLCMQWLLHPSDCASLPNLDNWAGMFPPIPQECGVLDNIYSFVAARQRKPGAATKLAIAVMHEARRLGFQELRTHIAQENLPAHRWARRVGLTAYGIIDRYAIKLPWVPVTYLYHHQTCEMHHLQPRHRTPGTKPRRLITRNGGDRTGIPAGAGKRRGTVTTQAALTANYRNRRHPQNPDG